MAIGSVLDLMQQEYGERRWQSGRDPISELIFTILSQNTSDTNSKRAYKSLIDRFGSWSAVAAAGTDEIAQSIRTGGLADVKAGRIKVIIEEINRKQGDLDLNFLSGLPLPEAKSWLRELPGVGPKTAACVLLFSLGRPAMPVDTHVFRVSGRLGLIDSGVSPEKAHDLLEEMVLPEDVYRFHVYMVEHGRKVCKSQRPRCSVCILRENCHYYRRIMRNAKKN